MAASNARSRSAPASLRALRRGLEQNFVLPPVSCPGTGGEAKPHQLLVEEQGGQVLPHEEHCQGPDENDDEMQKQEARAQGAEPLHRRGKNL